LSFHSLKAVCFIPFLILPAAAQTAIRIDPAEGRLIQLTGPYRARVVPPVNLSDTSRLDSLIRAGNLYLTAQDAVALAIENNLDIEVQRYAPLLAKEILGRANAGGALRSVGLGVAQGPTSVSLTGVSINPGGTLGGGGGGVGSGGGIVTQLGPSIPSLDPTVSAFANFQHATSPQSNTFLTGTTSLVQNTRSFQGSYSQNFNFGLNAQASFSISHIAINSPSFNLNPYETGNVDVQVTQNLLSGFGRAVNTRNIRVQKNNVKVTDLQFKQQVITTVSAVLNLYWDLVSFNDDLRARQREVEASQNLLENNKKQVDLGAIAEIEITRAEAQVYASQQDLLVSQTNLLQQETVLKNALSRMGVVGANLANVHVIPLDRISIPAADALAPLDTLVDQALSQRVEIEEARLNIDSQKMNLTGIKSSLKPSLQAFAELTNNGLSGELTALGAALPGLSYLAGGAGNLLAEIFRRNYPNYSAGVSLSITIHNRAAQSDYVTSQLGLRQDELNLQKNVNQIHVDVRNAVIGLQQARARYVAAQKGHALQQQTLESDQKKMELGVAIPYQIVQDQQALASAISQETQALANYTHARIAFDQALGATLEVNHIAIGEALSGRVAQISVLPANLPAGGLR